MANVSKDGNSSKQEQCLPESKDTQACGKASPVDSSSGVLQRVHLFWRRLCVWDAAEGVPILKEAPLPSTVFSGNAVLTPAQRCVSQLTTALIKLTIKVLLSKTRMDI